MTTNCASTGTNRRQRSASTRVNWPICVVEVRCWHTRAGKGETGSAKGPVTRQLALDILHIPAGFGAASTQHGQEAFGIDAYRMPSVHFRELIYECWRTAGKVI